MTDTVATKPTEVEIPHELTRYIEDRCNLLRSANENDLKTTSAAQLDAVRAEAIHQYQAGLEWVASVNAIDPEHLARCTKFYFVDDSHRRNDLALGLMDGQFRLMVRSYFQYERMLKVREAVK